MSTSYITSVFKNLASAKNEKKEKRQNCLTSKKKLPKPPQHKNNDYEKHAYFSSKMMRAAPQITPLAPLEVSNKMFLNMRLKEKKKQKNSKTRYKEKSEEILSAPHAFAPIEPRL